MNSSTIEACPAPRAGEARWLRGKAGRLLRFAARVAISLMPWSLRRRAMTHWLGYSLHPTSRIGWAWVFPDHLVLGAHATIDHLTVCKGLALLQLGDHAIIGRLNWLTGYPASGPAYRHDPARRSALVVGRHAAITHRHLLDCTNAISIGAFSTIAGFGSQFLTHSVDLATSRQASRPIVIGEYCFTGTRSIVLGGATLPHYSVLAAGSVLNKPYVDGHTLYAGSPARPVKPLPRDYRYFTRAEGVVH